jgi:hypothetical protein
MEKDEDEEDEEDEDEEDEEEEDDERVQGVWVMPLRCPPSRWRVCGSCL